MGGHKEAKPTGKMQDITTVTVAGVTGAIGPVVVQALHNAGFEVQALTRKSTSDSVKPDLGNVKIIEIDYSSPQELQDVLRGQDAVISTLGDTAGAVSAQKALIEASVATGVKRFIPSEFGSDTMNDRVRSFPFFIDKLKHQDLLKRATDEHPDFTYSIVITGPFLDWGLSVVPFIINIGTRSAQVFDGGDIPFSTTRVTTLAQALVATLEKSDATKNRTLYIHDGIVTQNHLIARSEALGTAAFSRDSVDTRALETVAWTAFGDPDADPLSWIFAFINISLWSGEELCTFRQTDNELLGITELQGAKLDNVVDAEISHAIKVFKSSQATAGNDHNTNTAEKAFEDGKRKLIGCYPSTCAPSS
ncbi:hypothetical protein LTR36_009477 [Oleoguttula mirabilis]|uniref:NmrA-like domain-containing protein n=1 Tax=Oleoguttula mirabilis TaxID=1507867 RepID=A0AAV9JST9_9PEZI|nr:hypothetical protein LTR36_009477 [Oleoguttula mirabilis]